MNLFNHDFLGTVTKVAPTKDGWVSIYADEKRVARVPRGAAEELKIAAGMEWSKPLAAACDLAAECFKARRRAVALLKVKARSSAELAQRLIAGGCSKAAAEAVIEQLGRERLLDDAALASAIAGRAAENGLSRAAAAGKLEDRGLAAAEVASPGESDLERAVAAARNRAGRLPESLDAPARARRLLSALARLGYEEDLAREAVERVLGFQDE